MLHVQPKAWRKFRLKRKRRSKSKKKCAEDRFIPIPAKLVWKIKERMRQRKAQRHDLVFPNGKGNPTVTSYAGGRQLRKKSALKPLNVTVFGRLMPTPCDSLTGS